MKFTTMTNKNKVFSFFSGSGFLDLGFEKSGFKTVYVNEYFQPFLDAYAFSRSKLDIELPELGMSNQPIENILEADVENLAELVELARKDADTIGFIGGPPCPDFSIGGKNKGRNGENGKLSETYIRLIDAIQPDWFLFENVKGLLRTKLHKEFFEELKVLIGDAYHLSQRLMNSIEVGCPQDRDRIFLYGVKKSKFKNNTIDWEAKLTYPNRVALTDFSWPTLSKFKIDGNLACPNDIARELTAEYWFNLNDVNTHPNALDHFTPRQALPKFKRIDEGDVSKKSFKRLHRWRYSPTVAYGNNEVHLHPYKARRLSVAEALSLQSMPKEFCLPPNMSLTNKFKTIGNGVPYLLGKHIAERVSESLQRDMI